MLTLQVGVPGSGKSYEATVYYILPAVKSGRKVITNIPVNIDAFRLLDPAYADLIEIRDENRHYFQDLFNERKDIQSDRLKDAREKIQKDRFRINETMPIFSQYCDYFDDWEHPTVKGKGALFVIDEAHEALPLKGVDPKVEHWYAKHRHFGHDIVLITQDSGKIFKNIRDLAEYTVLTKRLLLFGMQNRYFRILFDGPRIKLRPLSASFRKYDERFLNLYQSFTAGGGAFKIEVKPIWLNWKAIAFASFVIWSFGNFFANGAHFLPGVRTEQKPVQKVQDQKPVVQAASMVVPPISDLSSVERPLEKLRHPFFHRSLKIEGNLGDLYWLKEGRRVFQAEELQSFGYQLKSWASCTLQATHRKTGDVMIIRCSGSETMENDEIEPVKSGRGSRGVSRSGAARSTSVGQ
jgi:zona occludens toxin